MTTLKEFISANRDVKNEVSPAILVGRDSVGGGMSVLDVSSGALNVNTSGGTKDVKFTHRNDYSSTNVTTGAWIEIIASTTDDVLHVEIFDSSGETLEIGLGASGSETRLFLIPPGGISIDAIIASGSRIALKAVSSDATAGEFTANFIG